jgi:hypothetical protein
MLVSMGRNVIVSEETVRDLLEAHASLSAWYYELWAALRAANASARTPDDAARAAFVERLTGEFPEVSAVARTIRVPRLYVPAPPRAQSSGPGLDGGHPPTPGPGPDEPATLVEPAQARVRERPDEVGAAAAPATVNDAPAPPPMVDPKSVRYGQ